MVNDSSLGWRMIVLKQSGQWTATGAVGISLGSGSGGGGSLKGTNRHRHREHSIVQVSS
jgi:hypothetical protein